MGVGGLGGAGAPRPTWPAGEETTGPAPQTPAGAPASAPRTLPPAPGAGLPGLISPGGIDLLPRETLWRVASEGLARDRLEAAARASAAKTFRMDAAAGPAAEKTREQYFGPTYAALQGPGGPMGINDQLAGEAALAALPAALLGGLVKPAIDKGYGIIDKVPAALRRPLEKNFGLLIDTAMSASSAVVSPLVGATADAAGRGGVPSKVDLKVPTYGQMTMSCGETAAATILKAQGEPLALADVDTQLIGGGGSLLTDQEFRRKGLSLVTGTGDMGKLKSLVASGYPVMVSIKRDGKSDHYAVVTGYDEATKSVKVNNYDAKGNAVSVPYDKFAKEWADHKNQMTAVVPRKDARLEPILKAATDARRPTGIAEGFSVSDFYVTNSGKVFAEGAFRHVTKDTDVTVRVNFNNKEEEIARQLGGSISVRRRVADDWWVGLKVDKMSVRGQADNWTSFQTAPVAAYGSIEGPGFELKAGTERGGFQASVAADLSRVLSGMGVRANASVNPDGSYKVMGFASGTF